MYIINDIGNDINMMCVYTYIFILSLFLATVYMNVLI